MTKVLKILFIIFLCTIVITIFILLIADSSESIHDTAVRRCKSIGGEYFVAVGGGSCTIPNK